MSGYYGDEADGPPGGYRDRDGFSQNGFAAGPFGGDRPDGSRDGPSFDEPTNPQNRPERLLVPRPTGVRATYNDGGLCFIFCKVAVSPTRPLARIFLLSTDSHY